MTRVRDLPGPRPPSHRTNRLPKPESRDYRLNVTETSQDSHYFPNDTLNDASARPTAA